jgi:cellulose synthase operon protein C
VWTRPRPRVLFALALSCSLGGESITAEASIWPSAAERTAKQLGDRSVAVRRGAVQKLGALPRASARRLVLRALDDSDMDVRLAAAKVAAELRVTEARDRVVAWLGDPERRIRLAAAQVLAVAPTASAMAGLGRALGDPDADLRAAAATALAAMGKPGAAVLLAHLDDPAPQVRERVVAGLGEIRDPSAVVPLIGKIQDGQASVRRAVTRALGQLGDARASAALVLAVRDADESVRKSAVDALGRLGSAEAVPALVALVRDDTSAIVRTAAVRALARIQAGAAVDALVGVLGDPGLGSLAEQSLLDVGSFALSALERCVESPTNRASVAGCVRVLARIGPNRGLPLIRDAWHKGAVSAEVALEALGELGDPRALPLVLERLGDPEPRVRRAAIDASGALLDPHQPDGRAVGPILDVLDRARDRAAERRTLVALLGRTGSRAGVPTLVALAKGADSLALRLVAIEALGRVGPAGQDAVLLGALEDEHPNVRFDAAVALRNAASGAATSKLLDRAERAAREDRMLAALALGGALARSQDARLTSRVARLAASSRDGERDALIEALGRSSVGDPSAHLGELAGRGSDSADRAKVAEALGAHPEALPLLRELAADRDGAVRANAVWALGAAGTEVDRSLLARSLRDRDPNVAANAAAALGRLGVRLRLDVDRELCRALADERGYVRANALGGLGLVAKRCQADLARTLLARDRLDIVRRAAAWLIWRAPAADRGADQLALMTCRDEDSAGEVGASCARGPDRPKRGLDPVVVYVVPLGEASPVPRAPFALVRSDGIIRLGLADRRGVVFEHDAPRGRVALGVPASLVE